MATQEVHLELLLGKQVIDAAGAKVGRIEEMRAEQVGGEWVVVSYLVGKLALLARLSAWNIGAALLHVLGARNLHQGIAVPWDKLDLSDPDHPRLVCTIAELEASISQPD